MFMLTISDTIEETRLNFSQGSGAVLQQEMDLLYILRMNMWMILLKSQDY